MRLAEGSRPYPIPEIPEVTDDAELELDLERPARVVRAITSEDATSVSGEINGYQILESC